MVVFIIIDIFFARRGPLAVCIYEATTNQTLCQQCSQIQLELMRTVICWTTEHEQIIMQAGPTVGTQPTAAYAVYQKLWTCFPATSSTGVMSKKEEPIVLVTWSGCAMELEKSKIKLENGHPWKDQFGYALRVSRASKILKRQSIYDTHVLLNTGKCAMTTFIIFIAIMSAGSKKKKCHQTGLAFEEPI